jgi:hypothetical protein
VAMSCILLSSHVTVGFSPQDGTQVQLKSVGLQKYLSANGGGGGNLTVDQDVASTWETFRVCCLFCVNAKDFDDS